MPDSAPASVQSVAGLSLSRAWLVELVRLRENLWGPLDDRLEVIRVQAQGGTLTGRIEHRARLLADREGIRSALTAWTDGARLVAVLLCVVAVLSGAGAAAAALGTAGASVNLFTALMALLGLNLVMLILWCLGVWIQPGQSSWLASVWLRLTRYLARSPDAALAPRALLEVLNRQHATRWLSGVLSHGVWLLATVAMVVVLLVLLAARRYTFNWETTLLNPETFVALAHGLGALPALLGFSVPDAGLIRLSDGLHVLPATAQAQWSGWLIGCLVVYGVLPRAVLWLVCVIMARRRLASIQLDLTLPGWAELHYRLMPAHVAGTPYDPAPDHVPLAQAPRAASLSIADTQAAMVALDWPSDSHWPAFDRPVDVTDLGVIAGRAERNATLARLQQQPFQRLLIVCDACQTPDRGTLALLGELAAAVAHAHVLVIPSDTSLPPRATRSDVWHEALAQAGWQDRQQVSFAAVPALAWLKEHP